MELMGKILKGIAGVALWSYVFLLMFDENTNLPFFGDKNSPSSTLAKTQPSASTTRAAKTRQPGGQPRTANERQAMPSQPSASTTRGAKTRQPGGQPNSTNELQTLPSQVNLSNEKNHYWMYSCDFYSPDRLNVVATKVSNIIVNESRNTSGMNRRAKVFLQNLKPQKSTANNPIYLTANANDCWAHNARTFDDLLKDMDRKLTTSPNLEIIWGASDPKYFFQAKAEIKLAPYVIDICRGKRQYQTMVKLSGCDALGVY